MPEALTYRIQVKPAMRQIRMSVGNFLIDEEVYGRKVDLIGFRRLELDSLEAAAVFALHLRASGLEPSAG